MSFPVCDMVRGSSRVRGSGKQGGVLPGQGQEDDPHGEKGAHGGLGK